MYSNLSAKRHANANGDNSMAGFRQQANVAKKKEAIIQRLTSVMRERDHIEADLRDKPRSRERRPVLKGDDFRNTLLAAWQGRAV